MAEAAINSLHASLGAGLPHYCLHSPPCGHGNDVTSLSNNFHDDIQCRQNTTRIKSACQHAQDNCFMTAGCSQIVPTKSRSDQPNRELTCRVQSNMAPGRIRRGCENAPGQLNQIKYVQDRRALIQRFSMLADARNLLSRMHFRRRRPSGCTFRQVGVYGGWGKGGPPAKQRRTKARAGNDLTKLTSRQCEEHLRLADLSAKK